MLNFFLDHAGRKMSRVAGIAMIATFVMAAATVIAGVVMAVLTGRILQGLLIASSAVGVLAGGWLSALAMRCLSGVTMQYPEAVAILRRFQEAHR